MPVFDHLVYATPDLEKTAAELGERLGLAPVAGGSHPGMGTRNSLYGIGNGAYLEIIGPDWPGPDGSATPRWFGIAALTRPRLVGWAIRTEKIGFVVAGARERGYDPGDPVNMSREAADGGTLHWRLTMPPANPLIPFLIDWGETPHPASRGLPELTLEGFAGEHPDPSIVRESLGALGIGLTISRATHTRLTASLTGPHGRVELG